jgi:L,D-transpeptidase ErfK/SrfK
MILRHHKFSLMVAASMLLPATVCAEVFQLPPEGNDVVGAVTIIQARQDDTLIDIARRHGIGYEEIVRANPDVDNWLPGGGTEVVLPTRYVLPSGPRTGVILNLAEYRIYYYPTPEGDEPAVVMTYPMSIGRMDWETPLGRTKITAKVRNPAWYPPASVRAEHAAEGDPLPRIVPPGPDNPLGGYAMRLGIPGYLIHSTNRPAGVGMRVSHGCIRMLPEDIGFLFEQVDVNTRVRIINEPVKLGWDGEQLIMEVHQALEVSMPPATDAVESTDSLELQSAAETAETAEIDVVIVKDSMTLLTEQFVAVTGSRRAQLDWNRAEVLLQRANGIPTPVGQAIKNAATSAASD